MPADMTPQRQVIPVGSPLHGWKHYIPSHPVVPEKTGCCLGVQKFAFTPGCTDGPKCNLTPQQVDQFVANQILRPATPQELKNYRQNLWKGNVVRIHRVLRPVQEPVRLNASNPLSRMYIWTKHQTENFLNRFNRGNKPLLTNPETQVPHGTSQGVPHPFSYLRYRVQKALYEGYFWGEALIRPFISKVALILHPPLPEDDGIKNPAN